MGSSDRDNQCRFRNLLQIELIADIKSELDARALRSARSTWSLEPVSETETEITIRLRIRTIPAIGSLMEIPTKKTLKKLYGELLNDMAIFVETGRPSARKQQELAAGN